MDILDMISTLFFEHQTQVPTVAFWLTIVLCGGTIILALLKHSSARELDRLRQWLSQQNPPPLLVAGTDEKQRPCKT